jgi:hypothetical protein
MLTRWQVLLCGIIRSTPKFCEKTVWRGLKTRATLSEDSFMSRGDDRKQRKVAGGRWSVVDFGLFTDH